MKIELWSDFGCPFCYIGKKRFEGALNKFAHKDTVEVTYKAYQLNPNAPKVMVGAPNFLSMMTFLPLGPRVTFTASASASTPFLSRSLASVLKNSCLAIFFSFFQGVLI